MRNHPNRLLVLAAALSLGLAGSAFAHDGADLSQDAQNASREAQIWTTYAFNPHLRALDISVEVQGDTAVLTGTVEDGVRKDLAEQIALGVKGIEHVDNQLKIDAAYVPPKRTAQGDEREFGTLVEDATITASVKSKLLWNSHTDGLEINVDTLNGRVTLEGTADSTAVKELAGRLARNTDGVVAVDNRMKISESAKPAATATAQIEEQVSDGWITTKVKSTLLYSRWVDGLDIDVETKDGIVSLQGTVESSAEKDLAVELAQNIRGVRGVDASGLNVG